MLKRGNSRCVQFMVRRLTLAKIIRKSEKPDQKLDQQYNRKVQS